MTTREPRLLFADLSFGDEVYRPYDHWRSSLEQADARVDVVRIALGEDVHELDRYTHLLLTGSLSSLSYWAPWYDRAAAVARTAAIRGLRILGSCFGQQLLVHTLSGPEYVRRCHQPETGWLPIQIVQDDEILAGVQSPFSVFVSHTDEVDPLPDPWIQLAQSQACLSQVIRYGDRPIWGIQSHPEIDESDARRFLAALAQRHPAETAFFEEVQSGTAADDRIAPIVLKNFLAQT